jgi:hypothetical protein
MRNANLSDQHAIISVTGAWQYADKLKTRLLDSFHSAVRDQKSSCIMLHIQDAVVVCLISNQ